MVFLKKKLVGIQQKWHQVIQRKLVLEIYVPTVLVEQFSSAKHFFALECLMLHRAVCAKKRKVPLTCFFLRKSCALFKMLTNLVHLLGFVFVQSVLFHKLSRILNDRTKNATNKLYFSFSI